MIWNQSSHLQERMFQTFLTVTIQSLNSSLKVEENRTHSQGEAV